VNSRFVNNELIYCRRAAGSRLVLAHRGDWRKKPPAIFSDMPSISPKTPFASRSILDKIAPQAVNGYEEVYKLSYR
jgi:hypothetical protein